MTPAARLSASIDVLDAILAGQTAETALTAWGRSSRFAGSGDRFAVRDLVFAALRCKRSFAALGGSSTGRGLILGGLRAQGLQVADQEALFCGQGHAPGLIGPADQPRAMSRAEALDLPDWLLPLFEGDLGAQCDLAAKALQCRAPVFIRANPARTNAQDLSAYLSGHGVKAKLMQNLSYALQVMEGERKLSQLQAFSDGWFELQDLSSQAVICGLDLPAQGNVLDLCAGGGGKSLSIAAQVSDKKTVSLFAYDINSRRMADLPQRAARAGAAITLLNAAPDRAEFDLVLTDVPCSGSGSWRRDPQGKWALTPTRLQELTQIQAQIMDQAARLLTHSGQLAYCTCSVLRRENEDQVTAFLQRHPGFHCLSMQRFGLTDGSGGDGFFRAVLQRAR